MAYSYVKYTGDNSQTNFSIPYNYLQESHIQVYVDGNQQTVNTHYTFLNASTIQFVTPPDVGELVHILRNSGRSARLVDYQTSTLLDEDTLDQDSNQMFYLMQEAYDALELSVDEDSAVFITPAAILAAIVGQVGLTHFDAIVGAAIGYLNTNYLNDAIYTFDADGTIVYEDEVYGHGFARFIAIEAILADHEARITALEP